MACYALLGGRSIPHIQDFTLEEKIFQALKKRPKRILFIPFAATDIASSIQKFKDLVSKRYEIIYPMDFKTIEEGFQKADVIYFGGGSIELLLEYVIKSGMDQLLHKYRETDKLFMGISAGAILFSAYGMGDRYAFKDVNHILNYRMVEGLKILPITICPHYDHEGLDCYNDVVGKYPFDGYALEDDTAILFSEEIEVFKQDKKKSVYGFIRERNFIMEPLYETKKEESSCIRT